MQILSWNISGLKACLKSDSFNFIYDLLPDIVCLQEIRTQEDKPVILCGDFNVARAPMDIFEGNMRQYWAQQGYESDERTDFETLLEEGFTDVFRALYPDEISFTWWSNSPL